MVYSISLVYLSFVSALMQYLYWYTLSIGVFTFCPSASALPEKFKNAMAGIRKIGTFVSCLAMPKSSNRFVTRKALVTFEFSSLHSSTIASVAGIWELLRYLTSQRIFSRAALSQHQLLFDYPLLF